MGSPAAAYEALHNDRSSRSCPPHPVKAVTTGLAIRSAQQRKSRRSAVGYGAAQISRVLCYRDPPSAIRWLIRGPRSIQIAHQHQLEQLRPIPWDKDQNPALRRASLTSDAPPRRIEPQHRLKLAHGTAYAPRGWRADALSRARQRKFFQGLLLASAPG